VDACVYLPGSKDDNEWLAVEPDRERDAPTMSMKLYELSELYSASFVEELKLSDIA